MDPINFAYWLQSQFELNDTKSFNLAQTLIIKHHAKLVIKTCEINNKKEQVLTGRAGISSSPFPSSGRRIC